MSCLFWIASFEWAVAGWGAALAAGKGPVEEGGAAPAFSLPATSGGDVSLADLTKDNKFTVVYFYNQDGSPGCSVEAARFEQAQGELAKRGAKVVGISMDALEKHEEACAKGGLTFPLLSDASGDVSKAYGADLSIPLLGKFSDRQTFLVDKDQVVRGHWLERDGSMASVKAPLGPGSHAQQILDRLDALS